MCLSFHLLTNHPCADAARRFLWGLLFPYVALCYVMFMFCDLVHKEKVICEVVSPERA